MATTKQHLREALASIIDGKDVKRVRHDLHYDGQDMSVHFINELQQKNYLPMTVDQVRVQPGERVPAFFIKESIAYFGWVFWEQFTSWKIRKLWGSVIKNQRGDWDIQISPARKDIVYANELLKIEMDIDHPPEF
jgi:hypothetical protein